MSSSITTSGSDTSEQAGPRARRLRSATAAAVLVLGVAVAGCGSSGSTTTAAKAASVRPASQERVHRQGQRHLRQGRPAAERSHREARGPALQGGGRGDRQEHLRPRRAVADRPDQRAWQSGGEQARVVAMLKLVQADLAKLQRDPMLVNTDVFADFAKVAHPYGLTSCAPLS